jgi:DNA (cytosine-5)-methyltransferase 1
LRWQKWKKTGGKAVKVTALFFQTRNTSSRHSHLLSHWYQFGEVKMAGQVKRSVKRKNEIASPDGKSQKSVNARKNNNSNKQSKASPSSQGDEEQLYLSEEEFELEIPPPKKQAKISTIPTPTSPPSASQQKRKPQTTSQSTPSSSQPPSSSSSSQPPSSSSSSQEPIVKSKAVGIHPELGLRKCCRCFQRIDIATLNSFMEEIPDGGLGELEAMCNPSLQLQFDDDGGDMFDYEQETSYHLTNYAIFDEEYHMCPLDGGLIEQGTTLYFSGYLRPVWDENPDHRGAVCVKKSSPILQWFFTGFDGGPNIVLGIQTEEAWYYLMAPHVKYLPILNAMKEKILLSKILIEFLSDGGMEASYEDLLSHIRKFSPTPNAPHFTEDLLLKHAQFLVDQVAIYDEEHLNESGSDEVENLLTSKSLSHICFLFQVSPGERKELLKTKNGRFSFKKEKDSKMTVATTTPTVKMVFESFGFLRDQIGKWN